MTTLYARVDVFELYRVICRKSPILIYPTCIWCLRWGWPHSSFSEIFGIRKLSCGVVCVIRLLAVSVEHRLVTDRQTDRQTDRHMSTAYTALAWRCAVWNCTTHISYTTRDCILQHSSNRCTRILIFNFSFSFSFTFFFAFPCMFRILCVWHEIRSQYIQQSLLSDWHCCCEYCVSKTSNLIF